MIQDNKGSLSKKELNSNSKNVIHLKELKSGKKIDKISKQYAIKDKKLKVVKKVKQNYDDYELNSLEYLEAIKYDNRTFFAIYCSILKREHLIIFTFCSRNDYNIFNVKLSKLFFFICTDMVLNVFFFSDESMHNIYQSGGVYNFFEQLFQMVISTIVSQLLQIFINYLTMTDIHYYMIKSLEKKNINKQKILSTMNCIKYKINIFYIFALLLFVFYWYVVSAFCAGNL